MIEKIKDIAAKKSDWFDIYYSESTSTPIQFKNNRLYTVKDGSNSGMGIRLNKNGRTGLSYTNDEVSAGDIVNRALELAAYGEEESLDLPSPGIEYPEVKRSEVRELDMKSEIEKGSALIERVRSECNGADIDVSIRGGSGSRRLVNSRGLDLSDSYSFYSASLSATYIAKDGSRVETWSSLTECNSCDLGKLADRVIENINRSKTAAKAESGKVPVLLTPKAFASLLDIVIGGLNSKSMYKKISPYLERMDKEVFHKNMTICDNPLADNSPFNYAFDDEGICARKKDLIKDGVPREVISDIKYGGLTGVSPSGNSSRGYSSSPYASFSIIEVAPGTVSDQEMVGSLKHAIVVDQFLGLGQSNTFTGDFNANLDLAFLIKDGEYAGRVKDCMIADNIFEVFARETIFSSRCYNIGGNRIPYVLLDGVNFTS